MTTTSRAFRAIAIRDGLQQAIQYCLNTGQPVPLTRAVVEGEGWGDLWDARGRERLGYEIDSQLGVPATTLASAAGQLRHDCESGIGEYGTPRSIQTAPYQDDIVVFACVMLPEDEKVDVPYVDFIIAPANTHPVSAR